MGDVLKRAPTDTGPTARIFTAVISDIYLLPKSDLLKVLRFYQHYQLCENLNRSLYDHIREYVRTSKPLTDRDVAILKIRKTRVCSGYSSLLQGKSSPINNIGELPSTYFMPSTASTAEQINRISG